MSFRHPSLLALLLTCLPWSTSADGLRKCRLGDRILYQSAPCPPGFETLPVIAPATTPDQEAMLEARKRARADLAAAEGVRKRQAKEEAQRRAREARAERETLACARQLEVIRMMESAPADTAAERKKNRRRAMTERKNYIQRCGPLPW